MSPFPCVHRVVCGGDQAVQFAGEVGGLLVESAEVFFGGAELGAGVSVSQPSDDSRREIQIPNTAFGRFHPALASGGNLSVFPVVTLCSIS